MRWPGANRPDRDRIGEGLMVVVLAFASFVLVFSGIGC